MKGATNSLWARKYVRTGAHLSQNRRHCTPLLLIFYLSASFFFCLSLPVYYFWSVHLPIFVRHSFFSICRPLFFFSPFPLFAVSLPHQYLITLILFVKRMHTLCLSIHASHLFFSISSVSFINVFSKIHMKVNKMSEMSCYKQFNQESEVRKWIDRFIFSL